MGPDRDPMLGLPALSLACGFTQFALSYGVPFRPGARVLFIIAHQAVNQTVVQRCGLANCYVVSLYPLGAPVFG